MYTKSMTIAGALLEMDDAEYDYWQAFEAENKAFISKFGDDWSLDKNIDTGHYRWVFRDEDEECKRVNEALDARAAAQDRLAKLPRGRNSETDRFEAEMSGLAL